MVLYQFPPLGSSVAGNLLRVSCIFVADGAKTDSGSSLIRRDRQKPRKLRRWSPWSALVASWAARWCFVRWLQFGQNLEELAHGVRPVMLISLSWNTKRTSLRLYQFRKRLLFSDCYFNSSRPSASVKMRICWMAILLSFCKRSG